MFFCVLGPSSPSGLSACPIHSQRPLMSRWSTFGSCSTSPSHLPRYTHILQDLWNTTWPLSWQGAASNLHQVPPRPGGGEEDDQPPWKRSRGRSRPLVWEAFVDPSLWFEVSKLLAWWFRWVILILCSASHGKLFSVNEEVQREALKEFYERFHHMKYVYSKTQICCFQWRLTLCVSAKA